MSDYLKSTNFATKDSLPSGNAGKIVKGTEIDNEFNAIADAIESKADLLNPVFSGLLTTDTLATGGAVNIGGTIAVAGNTTLASDVQMTGTGRVLFPKGTTAQRPSSPVSGSVRFNTTLGYLENYTGTEWLPVGYVTPADVSDKTNTSTGYFQVPVGTDGQRTFTPVEGLIRYNTTQDIYEGYLNGGWVRFQTYPQGDYTISYLVAAGGGGGGSGHTTGNVPPGGGGAGGVITTNTVFASGTTYTVIVGAGGGVETQGSSSYLAAPGPVYIANCVGGGRGGPAYDDYRDSGGNGGSGGGQGRGANGGASAGLGTAGQGTNGNGYSGGGAGAIGNGLIGGAGLYSGITGTGTYYGGGGGGGAGSPETAGAAGGVGGGGQSGNAFAAPGPTGIAGGVNTGGGGGSGGGYTNSGGAGGSGVVILSIPTVNYSGVYTGSPVVSTAGANTILKFNASGSYTA